MAYSCKISEKAILQNNIEGFRLHKAQIHSSKILLQNVICYILAITFIYPLCFSLKENTPAVV